MPSRVIIFSPARGHADHDLGAGHLVEVEGVERLAALEEHEVGGVHHVGDGADAAGLEPPRQPGRRRADADALDDPRRVAEAAVRRLDADLHGLPRPAGACCSSAGLRVGAPRAPVAAATSRAMPRWESASGRFGVTFTSRTTSSMPSTWAMRRARDRVAAGRMSSPAGVLGEPELPGGAEHPVATRRRGAWPGRCGARPACAVPGGGQRDHVAHLPVGGAADHLQRLPAPPSTWQTESFSASGWRLRREDARRHHAVERGARPAPPPRPRAPRR